MKIKQLAEILGFYTVVISAFINQDSTILNVKSEGFSEEEARENALQKGERNFI